MLAIDLRSDTVTQPTKEMRQAMAGAEVGDDGWGDDPTVNLLQETAAARMGKEAALFVASGTMGNLVSVLAQSQSGEEIVVGTEAHLYYYEYGGVSALGGVLMRQLPNLSDGTLELDQVEAVIRAPSPRFPRTALICLENTHNRCSGRVLTPEYCDALGELAHHSGAQVHLDGARLFNAAVALGVPASTLTRSVDSVTFCLSKGLSCPVGSLICGSKELVARARRIRGMVGGGMRQAGVLAAAGLLGLEKMVERLSEDHTNAWKLGQSLAVMPGIRVDLESIETNIVILDLEAADAADFSQLLRARGLLVSQYGPRRLRMVTHYGIGSEQVAGALEITEEVARQLA